MRTFCYFIHNEIHYVKAVSRAQAENRMRYNFGSNPPYLFDEKHKVQIIKYYRREDFDEEMKVKVFVVAGKTDKQLQYKRKLIPLIKQFNPNSSMEDFYCDKPMFIGKFISSSPSVFNSCLDKAQMTLATLVSTLFFENSYIKVQ